MQSLLDTILLILKELGPENNALLLVTLIAFMLIAFSLYVLLTAIKVLAPKATTNG